MTYYNSEDSRLLFTLNHVHAYHIQNGQESSLTPSGSQTMSLLMIASDQNTSDFHLHLQLPPELDLPLPATTQVFPKSPHSYLFPRPDLPGAFTRIELPEKVSEDDRETFETILAQCTAFMARAPPPTGDAGHKPYDPAEWQAGGKFGGGRTGSGSVQFVDEDDGSVVGGLPQGAKIHEHPDLAHGTKSES